MTEDRRIITGAFVETSSDAAAVDAAYRLWQHVEGFHHPEVWLEEAQLYPLEAASLVKDRLDIPAYRGGSSRHVGEVRVAAA